MKENQAPTAVVAAEASATATTPGAQCAGDLGQKGVESHRRGPVSRVLGERGCPLRLRCTGEEIEDLLFALAASSIAFVPCRHEQGAAFIADVWGRLTGKAGVCLATLGPGATNLLTGVADANFDKAPLVAITGQGGLDRLHHESHQRIDVVRMFESVTKWNCVNLELVEKLKRYWQGASRALPRTREMS